MSEFNTARIRELNDRARQSFTGCRVVITSDIQATENVADILDQVRWYDQFKPDNDPYQEHDFGSFLWGEVQVFWQFSYYDLDYSMHSPDPADENVTARVLTVMLSEEY